MTEAELRQVWAGLMPPFPEPATVLGINDPDDRAVTMLLKTLYVVFKGVLDDRHQLRCCDGGTGSAAPSVSAAGPCTHSTELQTTAAESAAAGSRSASVEEIVPPSPGDLVPPSPGNTTYFSLPRRNVPVSATPVLHNARPVVLAPETMDVVSPPRGGRLPPRPVAETVPLFPPPTEVWVPETLDTSPVRSDGRPRPVVHETVPPPSTPPRPVRQPEVVSPVLPGRTPASRRARRAAGRAGAASSPVAPPPPLAPPRETVTAAQATAAAATVVSPTPSLSSPLLLPQRLPEMSRRQAAAETPKDGTEGSMVSSAQRTSRLSRTKPSQAGVAERGVLAAGTARQPPPAKKYRFIGPNDRIPPRKPRRAAGPPQENLQGEQLPSECGPAPAPQKRPRGETSRSASAGETASTSSCARATAIVTPTNTTAQSVLEPSAATGAAQKRSTAVSQTSVSGPASGAVTGTHPKQKQTPKKSMEQRGSSAPMGTTAGQPHSAESVVELDVLLEELDRDGAQTQAQRQLGGRTPGSGPGSGQEKWQDSRRVQTGGHGDATGPDDLHAHGGTGVQEPEEAVAPREDEQPEHESQDETQMDSLVFGDEQPDAGPSYKYDAGPVRRRAERQKLPGWSCALCKEWYADRDMTEEELRKHMNRCSRHRQKDPPPPDTPPGFWDPIDLPSMNVTQYGDDGPRTRARRRL